MKKQSQNKRLITIALVSLAVFAGAMLITSPKASDSTSSKPHSSYVAPAAPSDDQFTKIDQTARFPVLDVGSPDVFKPLIYHVTGGAGSSQPNAVPPDYASGEAGWAFTGIVAIDGAREASFENDKTGEFAQIGVGQHWKGCSISAIGDSTVTLNGMDGAKTLPLPVEVPTAEQPTVASNDANAPLNPPMTGDIGVDSAPTSDQGAASIDLGAGNGFGGRRGRGGRGGGRFGGGGGGRGGRGGGGGGGFGGGGGGG